MASRNRFSEKRPRVNDTGTVEGGELQEGGDFGPPKSTSLLNTEFGGTTRNEI